MLGPLNDLSYSPPVVYRHVLTGEGWGRCLQICFFSPKIPLPSCPQKLWLVMCCALVCNVKHSEVCCVVVVIDIR